MPSVFLYRGCNLEMISEKHKGGRGKLGTLQGQCGKIFIDYELLRKHNQMEAQFSSDDIVGDYED